MHPVAAVVVALQLLTAADAADKPCATPRQAAITWLTNLRDDRLDLKRAAKCTEFAPGMTRPQRERAVQTLKAVLDARGIVVRIDQLPDNAEYVDPRDYDESVSISPLFPAIYLEKTEQGWVFPASVLASADTLYESAVAIDLDRFSRDLPPWTLERVFALGIWQWLALILMVVVGVSTRFLVTWLLERYVHRIVDRFGIPWGAKVIHGASLPLGNLALAAAFFVLLPSLRLPAPASAAALVAVRLLAAFSAVMLLYRGVDLLAAYMDTRVSRATTKLDDQLVPLVRRGLKILVVTIGVVFVLQNLNIDVRSLIAGLGIGGLAVALAAKDTLGNFFGSLTIFLDRPFAIGDYVNVAGTDGTVETVGFRSTKLRTPNDSLVTIPNAKLAEDKVDNFGARRFRRVRVTLNLDHNTEPAQLEAFCEGVRAICRAHPKVRRDDTHAALFDLGDTALVVLVIFHLDVTAYADELRARHEVFIDVKRLAYDLGVRFAFPTRTLVMQAEAQEAPPLDVLVSTVRAYGPGGQRVIEPGPRLPFGEPAMPDDPARSV